MNNKLGDHGVREAPAWSRGVGFDAPAVGAGTFGGGKISGEPVRTQRGAWPRPRSAALLLYPAEYCGQFGGPAGSAYPTCLARNRSACDGECGGGGRESMHIEEQSPR